MATLVLSYLGGASPYVSGSGKTFTALSQSDGSSVDAGPGGASYLEIRTTSTTDIFYTIFRGLLCFSACGIPQTPGVWTLSSGWLYLYTVYGVTELGDPNPLCICDGSAGSGCAVDSYVKEDFQSIVKTNNWGCTGVSLPPISTSGNTMSLNSTGRTAIMAKKDKIKLGLCWADDVNEELTYLSWVSSSKSGCSIWVRTSYLPSLNLVFSNPVIDASQVGEDIRVDW